LTLAKKLFTKQTPKLIQLRRAGKNKTNFINLLFRILQSIQGFLSNSDHRLVLLNGSNLAILLQVVPVSSTLLDKPNSELTDPDNLYKCPPMTGLADYGSYFGYLRENVTPTASIQMPTKFACENGTVRSLYIIVYRKTQLFLPIRLLETKKFDKVAQLPDISPPNSPKYKTYEEFLQEADNCCDTYNLHADSKPVLTATFIDKHAILVTRNEALVNIRYSTKNVSKQ
jgi:hypothetical protein